jgi:hypothetical protein
MPQPAFCTVRAYRVRVGPHRPFRRDRRRRLHRQVAPHLWGLGTFLLSSCFAKSWHKKVRTAMSMRLASITIFVAFSLSLPAKAQSFSRQDLDCAVAATIAGARADKGTTGDDSFRELIIFFVRRLNAQDDQTNWARVVYDRSQLNRKRGSAELLAKCTELYQSSLPR